MTGRTKSGENARPGTDEVEGIGQMDMSEFQKQMSRDIRECTRAVDGVRESVGALRENIDTKLDQFREAVGVQFDSLRRDTATDRDKLDVRLQKLELELAKDAKDTEAICIWRDGIKDRPGAAAKIEDLEKWQTRAVTTISLVTAIGGVLFACFLVWFTSYLDTKTAERIAAAQAIAAPKSAAPVDNH